MIITTQVALNKSKRCFYSIFLIFITVMFVLAGCQITIGPQSNNNTPPAPVIPKLALIEFANTSGWVGNAVIIRGISFSDEKEKNIVKFGNVTARVIDLKGVMLNGNDVYELTAVVPENAITSKISVTVNGITETFPTDFVINTETVYAVGLEQNTRIAFPIAKYFKNGNAIKNFSDGTKEITIKKMVVVAEDVYVLGKEEDTNIKYWKNGIPVRFGNKEDEVTDIFVNGVDVYLVGDEMTTNNGIPWYVRTVYWKNGEIFDISNIFGVRINIASAIFVAGNDIYIAGYGLDYRAGGNSPTPIQYFKNGIGVNFDNVFNQNTAIFVAGNVYLTGFSRDAISPNICSAKYWVNGVMTSINDGSFIPTSITVIGTDVYVTVFPTLPNVPARYYKNNIPFLLENSTDITYQQNLTVLNNNIYVTSGGNFWKNGKKMPYLGATTLIARDQTTLNAIVVTQ